MPIKNFTAAFIVTAVIIASGVWHAQIAQSTDSYQVTHLNEFEMKANSTDELNEKFLTVAEEDAFFPEECTQFGIRCTQETIIKVSAETIWTITSVPPITSSNLTTTEFAENYPDIQEDIILTNKSDEKDKMIAQRILHERGLLPVEPTGYFGHLTTLAITHLQQLKEIHNEPGFIGPNTIRELNSLKDRMREENYLEENPLPPIEPEKLPEPLRTIYQEESKKVELIRTNPGFYQPQATSEPITVEKPRPFINYTGEIKLVPVE